MIAEEKTIRDLFKNVVHIGHRTEKWNPKVKKWLYGELSGIHIINLEKTVELLDRAVQFMSKMLSEGKRILFVTTKPQAIHLVEELAVNLKMPYVVNKWIPGLLTNFSTLKKRIKYLADLKDKEARGDFSKYTKKESANLKKIINKLENSLGGVSNLDSIPDAVFIVDVMRDYIVVKEADKLGIPVVAFVDTNADPSFITYPIPANDDALKSLNILFKMIEGILKNPSKTKK